VPKAKPSTNPDAPSRNPVAQWFASIPGVGGLFSQTNRAADWIDSQLGLLPTSTMHAARIQPSTGWSPHGVAAASDTTTHVVLNVDGDKFAEAMVKTQGRRKTVANGVIQAQRSAVARG
jgi:hypothetical protein